MAEIDEILVSVSPGETQVAGLSAGRLIDIDIERGTDAALRAIHRGRVVHVDTALNAAFVDIGRALPGFLPADAARYLIQPVAAPGTPIMRLVSEGASVLVQPIRPEVGDKGVGLTGDITIPGALGVLMPRSQEIAVSRRIQQRAERKRLKAVVAKATGGLGAIVRSAAAGAAAERLTQEFEQLLRLWRTITARTATAPALLLRPAGAALRAAIEAPARIRIWVDDRAAARHLTEDIALWRPELADAVAVHDAAEPLFARHDTDAQIDAALGPTVALPGGGNIVIETTAALTAIDVNSGDSAATPADLDRIAATEIARQLRLRAIGGIVVIDFPRLTERDQRERLIETLRAAVAGDRVPVQVMGWTRAGLVELTRTRARASLAALMHDEQPGRQLGAAAAACAALRAALSFARHRPAGRYRLLAARAVCAYLSGDGRAALDETNRRLGSTLVLAAEPARANDDFEIAAGGS
jgi:ribonuclease G